MSTVPVTIKYTSSGATKLESEMSSLARASDKLAVKQTALRSSSLSAGSAISSLTGVGGPVGSAFSALSRSVDQAAGSFTAFAQSLAITAGIAAVSWEIRRLSTEIGKFKSQMNELEQMTNTRISWWKFFNAEDFGLGIGATLGRLTNEMLGARPGAQTLGLSNMVNQGGVKTFGSSRPNTSMFEAWVKENERFARRSASGAAAFGHTENTVRYAEAAIRGSQEYFRDMAGGNRGAEIPKQQLTTQQDTLEELRNISALLRESALVEVGI